MFFKVCTLTVCHNPLHGQLKLDINIGSLGKSDDVGEFDGHLSCIVEVVAGKDSEVGHGNEGLRIIHISTLLEENKSVNFQIYQCIGY